MTTKSAKQLLPRCRWTEDEDGNWDTDCNNKHVLNDGGPKANGMMFCCYCGKHLQERAR